MEKKIAKAFKGHARRQSAVKKLAEVTEISGFKVKVIISRLRGGCAYVVRVSTTATSAVKLQRFSAEVKNFMDGERFSRILKRCATAFGSGLCKNLVLTEHGPQQHKNELSILCSPEF